MSGDDMKNREADETIKISENDLVIVLTILRPATERLGVFLYFNMFFI